MSTSEPSHVPVFMSAMSMLLNPAVRVAIALWKNAARSLPGKLSGPRVCGFPDSPTAMMPVANRSVVISRVSRVRRLTVRRPQLTPQLEDHWNPIPPRITATAIGSTSARSVAVTTVPRSGSR